MYEYRPKRVFFEQQAMQYNLGRELWEHFRQMGVETQKIASHNRVTGIPGKTPREGYLEAKQTLVVGVRKSAKFEGCKPSAHYQLPLVTSCPGTCQYCYLNTTLGKKPYIRVYVNIEDILDKAQTYMEECLPEITLFEGAATSDPLPVEPYTGSLFKAIEFFGKQEHARFRFVTKFDNVDSLLTAKHNGHTRFRFSLNSETVINSYEQGTPRLAQRLIAAGKVAQAGYPLGFLIAPIFVYAGWKDEYESLFNGLVHKIASYGTDDITFELITHRFTTRAKNNILNIFPDTSLPMDEELRKYKYGQFGYGKYVYPPDQMHEIKQFMTEQIESKFPTSKIEYLV